MENTLFDVSAIDARAACNSVASENNPDERSFRQEFFLTRRAARLRAARPERRPDRSAKSSMPRLRSR